MEKKTYDMRGHQANIARLFVFDKEGFVHMLFYRILIFYSVVYGLAVLVFLTYGLSPLLLKAMTAVLWIFFTPQVYETAKGFSLIGSKGLAFGHLSEEYIFLAKNKYHKGVSIFPTVTTVAFAMWIIGFVMMLLWWNI